LSGWDRVVLRGTLRMLAFAGGMAAYLSRVGVLLKNFGDHAQAMTDRLIQGSLRRAEAEGRPIRYLASSRIRKDDYARDIAQNDGISEGLICVLTCVEPCRSFEIYRNRDKKLLEIVARNRKCKFLYHYWLDPQFGFMSARVQTWFPFSVQVCINGREWLARRMNERGMAYERYDNSFPRIEDFAAAQTLFDRMHRVNWPKTLDAFRRRIHPAHGAMFRGLGFRYYWSAFQTEWATDLSFDSAESLAAIYPPTVRGAIASFGSEDVMRFLGHRLYRNHEGPIVSDYLDRPEGVRVKHRAKGNSVKVYDKGGSILRIETTINNPAAYRSYRSSESDPEGEKSWRPMRSGVAVVLRRRRNSPAALARFTEWYNQWRPHTFLRGRTPKEAYHKRRPACRYLRFEPRPGWPHGRPELLHEGRSEANRMFGSIWTAPSTPSRRIYPSLGYGVPRSTSVLGYLRIPVRRQSVNN